MKKASMLLVLALILVGFVSSVNAGVLDVNGPTATASATSVSQAIGGTSNVKNNNTVKNTNTNNIKNSNTNNNTNNNSNLNSNNNTNLNVIAPTMNNRQSQNQGQAQGQEQFQAINNGQTIAPVQSITYVQDRALLAVPSASGPALTEYRGPYDKDANTAAKPWEIIPSWTAKAIDALPSDGILFKDCSVEAVFFSGPILPASEIVPAGVKDLAVLGYVTVKSNNGSGSYSKVFKRGMEIGMEYGARYYRVLVIGATSANVSSGFSVGLAGGASATSTGKDNYGGSVGGGTGYSSIETGPVSKPWILIIFY